MLFKRYRDLKFRKKYAIQEKNEKVIKFVTTNLLSKISFFSKSSLFRKYMLFLLIKLKINNLNFSKVKILRRCIFTNRNRSILRSYQMSRFVFRNLNQFGLIPGYKKAV